jgi:hypothetical protein
MLVAAVQFSRNGSIVETFSTQQSATDYLFLRYQVGDRGAEKACFHPLMELSATRKYSANQRIQNWR